MRKAVLQDTVALDIITISQKAPVPLSKLSIMCSDLMSLMMYHFY